MMIHILKLLINMRIINFRGLDSNTNKWLYGYLSWYESPEKGLFINGKHVIPESVGQFTGLYDINGKEIYEGDIVYLETVDKQASVTFEEDYCCFCFRYDKGSVDYNTYSVTKENVEYFKVQIIGNIHE